MIDESVYGDNDPHWSGGPLCDNLHTSNEMTLHELENQLLVIEDQIMQVLTRAYGAHKFIEHLMWKK